MSSYVVNPIPFCTRVAVSYPDTNFGYDATSDILYSWTAKTYAFRTILVVDLSTLIGEIVESTSELYLRASSVLATTPATIYRITQAGVTEDGASWNKYDGVNNWATAGGDYSTPSVPFTYPAAAGDISITGAALAALIQDALDSRSGILRMIARVDTEATADRGGGILTEDYANPAMWPRLTVVYTPRRRAVRVI